ncbi:MAG TPA: M1 family aminopeptidase [Glaciibacter sp.]|nr:M1 family aminopeptidase [Glaciibacter sp.]
MNIKTGRRATTFAALGALLFCGAALPGTAAVAQETSRQGSAQPGAPGLGDPYYPLDGNGGYDVKHYLLNLRYEPESDRLAGTAVITSRATQDLSAFNLDFEGLTVRAVTVNARSATWTRDAHELTITPHRPLADDKLFVTTVTYDGVPEIIEDAFGISGFFHTDDGATIVGQPHVATTWFPVNDHPLDKAAYTFRVTVPEGLEVVANGRLLYNTTRNGQATWAWHAKDPMASYLATVNVGEFDINEYTEDGIRFLDALDPDLFAPIVEPRTGENFAWSQRANDSYKRLTRTISVPEEGGQLSFWMNRDTEEDWDFTFVEARTPGDDDWTTLPDVNGHTTNSTGESCPGWHELHPFLTHYQTADEEGVCTPTGTSGEWWAATGASEGWEEWAIDLDAYAGSDVELSISYASDDIIQRYGVSVDDVTTSHGEGTTSFEDDGNTLDGWAVSGPPEGSPGNENDWIVTSTGPASLGEVAEGAFARQPEIINFLEEFFGPYPFRDAGGIVDDLEELQFALETQTRPVYSKFFFEDEVDADSVVVHELAHQWVGNSVALEMWQHIWLNEGFATYAEWLWSEREGLGTVQETFDSFAAIPADDPFWSVMIGDPGPDALFDFAVYARGAMTLHAVRQTVGDDDFFRILREWVARNLGGNVSTDDFIALAEEISGEELNPLFDEWLFTDVKPPSLENAAALKSAPDGQYLPWGAGSIKGLLEPNGQ